MNKIGFDSQTYIRLQSEHIRERINQFGGKLYLDGDFTYGGYCDKWQMEYNERSGCYEKAVLLKMGSYDYRYIWVPDGSTTGETAKTEGDSFETSNEYQIYVWFRKHGARYDRLVGLCDLRMTK